MPRKKREETGSKIDFRGTGKKGADRAAGKKLSAVASAFDAFRPAREVMQHVRAVPTRFVQIDHATGVGGWPIERFTLVHGPSGHGKTSFCLGLIGSFLDRSHYADFIDLENTTPKDFARKAVGASFESPRFFYSGPQSFESVVARTRNFCNALVEQRRSDPQVTGLIVVDSLKKLMPADMFDLLMKTAKDSDVSAGVDRAGQLAAKANTAWMNELTVLLSRAVAGMVVLGREMENPDAKSWERKSFGNLPDWAFKLGGGKAPFFEASLVGRVELQGEVREGGKDDFEGERKVFGERHRVVIYKTKVSGHESKKTVGFFHTSNGTLVPEGFDRARDVLEIARRFDVVSQSGSWLSHGRRKIGQGEHKSVEKLTADPGWLAEIEGQVREKFGTRAQVEIEKGSPFDAGTGEVVE